MKVLVKLNTVNPLNPFYITGLFLYSLRGYRKRLVTRNGLMTNAPIIYPANIYLFKVNNRNTRKRCETYTVLVFSVLITNLEPVYFSVTEFFILWNGSFSLKTYN